MTCDNKSLLAGRYFPLKVLKHTMEPLLSWQTRLRNHIALIWQFLSKAQSQREALKINYISWVLLMTQKNSWVCHFFWEITIIIAEKNLTKCQRNLLENIRMGSRTWNASSESIQHAWHYVAVLHKTHVQWQSISQGRWGYLEEIRTTYGYLISYSSLSHHCFTCDNKAFRLTTPC